MKVEVEVETDACFVGDAEVGMAASVGAGGVGGGGDQEEGGVEEGVFHWRCLEV